MKAILFLEDGTSFEGKSVGYPGESGGEVVFNTSMTGYQEILTDPSYAGQIVTMTYPLIGNYGVNKEDVESKKIWVKGFVVKELCRYPSNYRMTQTLDDYLKENQILAIEAIDTRKLTKHIREKGAMRGIISTEDFDPKSLMEKIKDVPQMNGADWAKRVTTTDAFVWNPKGDCEFTVAAIDCGIKWNILRIMEKMGCKVHVFPAQTNPSEILKIKPDGVFISNGPGDPASVTYVIDTIKELLGKVPIFGICLGHQMIAKALGGDTYKLKFGHRGANHPVRFTETKKVEITTQNHGFCVSEDSLTADDIEVTHINLNDKTVEGIRHKKYPLFSVQHHPEASAGPHDSEYLFELFINMMREATCQNAQT